MLVRLRVYLLNIKCPICTNANRNDRKQRSQSNSVFLGRHWDKLLVTLLLLFEKLTLSGIIGSWGLETDGLSSLCVTEATIIAVISADTMTGSHQVTSGHNGLRSVHKTVTRGHQGATLGTSQAGNLSKNHFSWGIMQDCYLGQYLQILDKVRYRAPVILTQLSFLLLLLSGPNIGSELE